MHIPFRGYAQPLTSYSAAGISEFVQCCNNYCIIERIAVFGELVKLGAYCYTTVMDKSITVIQQSDHRNSGFVPGTAEERVAMVWPLTCEAVSLGKKHISGVLYDAEQPLQKHIVNIIRKKS